MHEQYSGFKFSIGQFVKSSFCCVEKQKDAGMFYDHFQIIERVYQECPGGVQLNYVCRQQNGLSRRDLIRLNEIELMEM